MRAWRLPVGLIVPGVLVLLVGLLGGLQYRWLGQVSDAERDRLRASLRQSAEDLADDFDRELMRLHAGLQTDGARLRQHDWSAFAARYDAWRAEARFPAIVGDIYLLPAEDRPDLLLKFHPDPHRFEPAEWPASLAPVKAALARHAAASTPAPESPAAPVRTLLVRETLFPSIPALRLTLPSVAPLEARRAGDAAAVFTTRLSFASLIVELNREYIRSELLPSLVTRYFPNRSADLYRFAVIDGANAAEPIFARGLAAGQAIAMDTADASVPLFTLRAELEAQVALRPAGPGGLSRTQVVVAGAAASHAAVAATHDGGRLTESADVAIRLEPRGQVFNFTAARVPDRAPWQLVLQHRAGSLDAAVGRARQRNLWLAFGILAVLAAGVALVVVNAERSRALAARQMDFVATVSHELRTPLTVIRSAAQNLSAGVVHDAAQAKRYGELIETEGRRLTDMVEQVLEFAGLSGNRRLVRALPVDAGALVRDVVASAAPLFEQARVEVAVEIAPDAPAMHADEDAVRRALSNLISNAVKYGADGRWIGVSVRAARTGSHDEVQIAVSDRGRGVAAEDLPHLFEAFYRGRDALDRQIHGNGLGLSLVKRIAEAHDGRVTVASRPGEGATFTLHLPAATGARALRPLDEPAAEGGTAP